jgi:hypothetical protein
MAGKTVEQSFKKSCIINAFDILWENSDLGCPELRSDIADL